MIGKTKRSGDFGSTISYVLGKKESTLLLKRGVGVVDDPERIAGMMRSCAARSRSKTPVYHLIVAWDPADRPGHDAMADVAKRLLRSLGLDEHQVIVAAHADCDHPHMHIVANRVHPNHGGEREDGEGKQQVWRGWKDGEIIQRELRELERVFGWRQVEGRLALQIGHEAPTASGEVKRDYHARKKKGLPPVQRGRTREDAGDRMHVGKPSGRIPPELPRTARQLVAVWKAAGEGDPECQWKMGHVFGAGIGVPFDEAVAAGWMQLAAMQGHPRAARDFELYTRDGRSAVNPPCFGGEGKDGFVMGMRYSERPKEWIGEWIGERVQVQEVGR